MRMARSGPRHPPLLHVIFDALRERGWTIGTSYFQDPEGNRYESVESAIEAQTFREIADAGSPPSSSS
jgi:hypothetical protein